MWSLTNDYSLTNIGGGRPLGEYTEIAEQIKLLYEIAQKLGIDGRVFAQIDPGQQVYKIGQGDSNAAMIYGLKPYILAPEFTPQPLVGSIKEVPTLHNKMHPTILRSALRNIVEES